MSFSKIETWLILFGVVGLLITDIFSSIDRSEKTELILAQKERINELEKSLESCKDLSEDAYRNKDPITCFKACGKVEGYNSLALIQVDKNGYVICSKEKNEEAEAINNYTQEKK